MYIYGYTLHVKWRKKEYVYKCTTEKVKTVILLKTRLYNTVNRFFKNSCTIYELCNSIFILFLHFQAYFISDFFTQVKRKPDDITLQNIRESAPPTNYNTANNPNNDGGTVI